MRQFWSDRNRLFRAVGSIAIVAAFLLTILSMTGLCSEECAEGHKWKLFGMPFELPGLFFFAGLGIFHWIARDNTRFQFYELLAVTAAIGAEIYFIYIQKIHIGTWCPICLAIAACVAILFMSLYGRLFLLKTATQENTMKPLFRGLFTTSALFIGLLTAFIGTTKYDAMEAAQTSIQDNIAFGAKDSDVEVYLFTDWACPACRKLEPLLKKNSKVITQDAKLYFIDHAIHPETLNFIPFHLSFMVNNKPQYFELRDMLTEISVETGSPTEKQVTDAAAKLGVNYKELNFADISLGVKFFKALGEKFKVEGTPTMVIVNTNTKKGKKLTGNNEITAENIQKAITALKNQ